VHAELGTKDNLYSDGWRPGQCFPTLRVHGGRWLTYAHADSDSDSDSYGLANGNCYYYANPDTGVHTVQLCRDWGRSDC
jgi:hypothetical protein